MSQASIDSRSKMPLWIGLALSVLLIAATPSKDKSRGNTTGYVPVVVTPSPSSTTQGNSAPINWTAKLQKTVLAGDGDQVLGTYTMPLSAFTSWPNNPTVTIGNDRTTVSRTLDPSMFGDVYAFFQLEGHSYSGHLAVAIPGGLLAPKQVQPASKLSDRGPVTCTLTMSRPVGQSTIVQLSYGPPGVFGSVPMWVKVPAGKDCVKFDVALCPSRKVDGDAVILAKYHATKGVVVYIPERKAADRL